MNSASTRHFDVLIIGAGGAGMMCAARAANRGKSVALLDHSSKLGRKILISGGGRCNFTNIGAKPENYLSENADFARSAMARFTPQDFIALVEKHKIAFHEKKLGQLFCDARADQIVEMLRSEVVAAGAEFFLDCKINALKKQAALFEVTTSLGIFSAPSLVIATGGLSIPKIGATDFGYQIAKQFDLKIISPEPALDGFVLSKADQKNWCDLTGISLDSVVSVRKNKFRENLLITHHGLSGPAMLQASLYWKSGDEIKIDLLPGISIEKSKLTPTKALNAYFSERFSRRFCEIFAKEILDRPLLEISDERLKKFTDHLHSWILIPEKTVGFEKAEVTRGGVDTNELSSKTMEAKKMPGLYFIGEVVDVTGQLGGYNFQWAWASGAAAGDSV